MLPYYTTVPSRLRVETSSSKPLTLNINNTIKLLYIRANSI